MHGQQNNKYTEMHGQQNDKYAEMHGQQNNKYTELHGQQNDKYAEMHGQQNNKYTEMHGQQNVKNLYFSHIFARFCHCFCCRIVICFFQQEVIICFTKTMMWRQAIWTKLSLPTETA